MQEAISTDPSTPTTVAWVPESWHRPCVVRVFRVCCRVSLAPRRFLRVLQISPRLKTQHFQSPVRSEVSSVSWET